MDKKDKKIIEILMKDGRTKLNKISKEVNLPITTVFNRLKKLQSEEIIDISANLNRKKLGYDIELYILISIDTSTREVDQEKLAKKLVSMKNILEASIVTGSKDIVVKATTRNIDEMRNLILKELRGMTGVARSESLVIMKEYK